MILNIKIDKDIPPPSHNAAKYPFAIMEVGESFALKGDRKTADRVQQASHKWAGENDKKMQTKRSFLGKDNDGNKRFEIRVWRIK